MQQFNPNVSRKALCKHCHSLTNQREVLMTTPCSLPQACSIQVHYLADWECIDCNTTQSYGLLVPDGIAHNNQLLTPAVTHA